MEVTYCYLRKISEIVLFEFAFIEDYIEWEKYFELAWDVCRLGYGEAQAAVYHLCAILHVRGQRLSLPVRSSGTAGSIYDSR